MPKQEVRLMFFSGFYESIHNDVFDSEERDIIENYPGKNWDDFRWTYDWLRYSKSYVSAISRETGLDLEFQELISPREYNFSTDRIICWIKPKDVKKLATALNSPTLEKLVKERFTSRDGFISFYSNDVSEWKEKKIKEWDAVEMGTLLDAWLIDQEISPENLDYAGYDYCSGNGQYVDYEKMWDEEKNLHEEELAKLEKWKTAVAGWKE